mmetsp:Transcript_9949/g.60828  ORF Transcript_9949/g.60828 Transcript_9949/m.60828 type:complete len:244 (+) Transcript_9949:856-1587(+)
MTHPWKTHVSCSPPSRKRSIQRNAGRRNMGTKGPRPPCIEKKKYKLFLGGDLRPSRQARSLVLFLQRAECRDEGFVELPKPSLQNVFSSLGVLELLRAQLVQQTAHALLHDPQREHGLVLPAAHAGTTHGLPCQTMERQHVPEHPHALVKRAELIVRGEAVLLEEVLLEETCRFQGHLNTAQSCRIGRSAIRYGLIRAASHLTRRTSAVPYPPLRARLSPPAARARSARPLVAIPLLLLRAER